MNQSKIFDLFTDIKIIVIQGLVAAPKDDKVLPKILELADRGIELTKQAEPDWGALLAGVEKVWVENE